MSRIVEFSKYQGTGNDFVLINQMEAQYDLSTEQIAFLCHRRFGIGADGLMFLRPIEGYDFEMVYYNSDGHPSSMCGNGGRCIVKFAHDLGYIQSETSFLAIDGPHFANVDAETVALQMIDVEEIIAIDDENTFELNTGSPHYIHFTEEIEDLEKIITYGKIVRYSDKYAQNGINVNLVCDLGKNELFMATYERGVEDETYSCGTGVTAAALAYGYKHQLEGQVKVKTKGGTLWVNFINNGQQFYKVVLIGAATFIFKGSVEL